MFSLSMNTVTLLYLIASVCFIQALKGLSHPTTSIRGNVFGMAGMAIAVLTTVASSPPWPRPSWAEAPAWVKALRWWSLV